MKLTDYEIINVHQTTKDFTIWYQKSIESISKYISYNEAKELVQYSLMNAINEVVIMDPDEMAASKSNLHNLYESIFETLDEKAYQHAINSFENSTDDYQEFMKQYKLDRFVKIKETGKFWLKYVDSIYDSVDKQIELLDDLIPYVMWTFSYAFEYTKQYITSDIFNISFNLNLKSNYNYWDLKEHERLLDIYPLEKDKNEYVFHNREELLYDLVQHGVFLPFAKKITHRVRIGKGLNEKQTRILDECNYDILSELDEIKYLPSISEVFSKVFRVNKLI